MNGPRGGRGPGMMDGGPGFGPQGGGPGFGPKGGPGPGPGFGLNQEEYDPASIAVMHEAILAVKKAAVGALEQQAAAAAIEEVKSALSDRLAHERVEIGLGEARLAALKALPADRLAGAITVGQAEVNYLSAATSENEKVQDWITHQLEMAKAHLARLEAQQSQGSGT